MIRDRFAAEAFTFHVLISGPLFELVKTCHACNKEVSIGRSPGRRDLCPHCRSDLHCCGNCEFHDPSVAKQCREPGADLVKEKNKPNFCDYFRFADRGGSGGGDAAAVQARKALNDLFKQ